MKAGSARAVLIGLVLLLTLAPVSGCGRLDAATADDAIAAANEQAEEFNSADESISKTMVELVSLGETAEDSEEALSLLDQADADLARRASAIRAARAEYAKIGALDVSDELKTYARQQLEIWQLQAEVDASLAELFAKTREIYTARLAGTLDDATAARLRAEAKAIGTKVDERQAELEVKSRDSSDYFDANVEQP